VNTAPGTGVSGAGSGAPSNAILSDGNSGDDVSPSSQAANSAPDAPIYNTQGATRAAANSGNWSDGSLSQTVENIAGSNPQVTYTTSGKTIYTNPTTGASVVYDNAGNYYRVQNAAGQYLDQNGNPIPNNVPLIGPNKTTQTGVPSGVRNGLTHFNNTDPGK
jgi:filamentous hemagglutinin